MLICIYKTVNATVTKLEIMQFRVHLNESRYACTLHVYINAIFFDFFPPLGQGHFSEGYIILLQHK